MRNRGWLALACLVVVGCTSEAPPPPPVPPAPEDLSQWSVPELVQPPPPPEPVPLLAKEKLSPGESVLDYAPGTTYTLIVTVGTPLDVVLEKGEHLRNIIGADRAPVEAPQGQTAEGQGKSLWDVKEGAEGMGDTLRSHLFLTAAKPGLTLGLVLTTTKRAYYLTCKSVKTSLLRTVRWRYPVDQALVVKTKEPGLLPDPDVQKLYHVGYELVGNQPAWQPRQIVDDGKKTYIIYPEVALFEAVPMVRLVGPNGPQLVNARQFLNVVILDQLLPRAELKMGLGEHAEVVTITRGAAMQTIACPGDAQCPVWPRAAQVLARRGTSAAAPSAPTPPPSPPVPQKVSEAEPPPLPGDTP